MSIKYSWLGTIEFLETTSGIFSVFWVTIDNLYLKYIFIQRKEQYYCPIRATSLLPSNTNTSANINMYPDANLT